MNVFTIKGEEESQQMLNAVSSSGLENVHQNARKTPTQKNISKEKTQTEKKSQRSWKKSMPMKPLTQRKKPNFSYSSDDFLDDEIISQKTQMEASNLATNEKRKKKNKKVSRAIRAALDDMKNMEKSLKTDWEKLNKCNNTRSTMGSTDKILQEFRGTIEKYAVEFTKKGKRFSKYYKKICDDNLDLESSILTQKNDRAEQGNISSRGCPKEGKEPGIKEEVPKDPVTIKTENCSVSEEFKKLKKKRHSQSADSLLQEPEIKRQKIKQEAPETDESNQSMSKLNSQASQEKERKNIREVIDDEEIGEDSKRAVREEKKRLKRVAERQKKFEMYESQLEGKENVKKLVLDIDEETKEELVSVDEALVQKLKPHQLQGIKFMWDACFESLERTKTTEGSGCIIAHCMGLGKTVQVITLAHTILNQENMGIKTIMIVCPLSTVLNWVNEFKTWLKLVKDGDNIEIYELTKIKKHKDRHRVLEKWQRTGGILIIGYEMFRILAIGKGVDQSIQKSIYNCLINPGSDLVICDEGHKLKNEKTALSEVMRQIRTLRRIALTGTPLQNNLDEYHCMMQFVKPNLLGSKEEFKNRFVHPINNGQCKDSTTYDVKLMKRRAYVLHKMLEGCVQRFDFSVLTLFLPPKQEYVIFVRLSEVQIQMYKHYLENLATFGQIEKGSVLANFKVLQRLVSHPMVLHMNADKIEKAPKKASLKNSAPQESVTKNVTLDQQNDVQWWEKFIKPEQYKNLKESSKLSLLFAIIQECEEVGDKLLVFSQSLDSLTVIEKFLAQISKKIWNSKKSGLRNPSYNKGTWKLGLDYFRLDGRTPPDHRSKCCKLFNNAGTRARLFLISTKAGGVGINLTGANRVVIFDASWNPSDDQQAIFRIYRLGQTKPCYVYRFLAFGTIEETIYNRQVTKLSLACRVVDEQQIERHYTNHDLAELYSFQEPSKERPVLNCPKDHLFAEVITKCKDVIVNFHEHDSLLKYKEDEDLDEDERKAAWNEYEHDKQAKPFVAQF